MPTKKYKITIIVENETHQTVTRILEFSVETAKIAGLEAIVEDMIDSLEDKKI